jgi:tetratricopeptide (TPR) repeat protein
MQGDTAAMQRHTEWANGTADEDWMLWFQAQAHAFAGKLQSSRELYRRADAIAERRHATGFQQLLVANEALTEAGFGNYRKAREGATRALGIKADPSGPAIGLAFAFAGDVPSADAFVTDMVKRRPTDTLVNNVTAPSIRAAIELSRNNPARAIELLQPVAPYEYGTGPGTGGAGASVIYLRGQAYLRARQGTEAVAEFQKILDHRGVIAVNPVYALAHLGVARGAALAGDIAKSRRAYQDFLALWKDADPDIPVLQQAKAEYVKLK